MPLSTTPTPSPRRAPPSHSTHCASFAFADTTTSNRTSTASGTLQSGTVELNDNKDVKEAADLGREIDRAYSSSYVNYLLDHDPQVCSVLQESLDTLPADGPGPLYGTDPNITYLHVDTGVTCAVTNRQGELHCPMPSKALCGTSQQAARVPITAIGTFVLDLLGHHKTLFPIEIPGACEIPAFGHHSFSLQAIKNLG
jgi:hypothetical protein